MEQSFRIGVDVGGTFTDLIVISSSKDRHIIKVPSVPSDPGLGVINALNQAEQSLGIPVSTLLNNCSVFIHGSTVATNLLLEDRGANVGLIVTAGFRDALEIRRGQRRDVWNHREPFAPVLVPRYRRIGVRGRLDADGRIVEPLNKNDVQKAAQLFMDEDVDSVAICLLHAYRNSDHEQCCSELLSTYLSGHRSARWITLSSEVAPVIGEFDRTSTSVVNAYLSPRVSSYLMALGNHLKEMGLKAPLLIQQSNGGALSVAQAIETPVNLLLSGPAASVGGLRYYSRNLGVENLIAMEIGGTSTDVTVMNGGSFEITDKLDVAGYPVTIPAVNIHTVGAGGGTIAGVDVGGMLYCGPQGAGSYPGPAAYGLGGQEPTVTDAQVVLGRLSSGKDACGGVGIDEALSRAAIQDRIAGPLGISIEEAAIGILKLANLKIQQAVERITIERGIDVRNFVLIACGGAGPMHGVEVARALGIPGVYVPRLSGAFCAFGMLNSDIRSVVNHSLVGVLNDKTLRALMHGLEPTRESGRELMKAEGIADKDISTSVDLNLKYSGQQWDLVVAVEDDNFAQEVREKFESTYDVLFGHIQPGGEIRISGARVATIGHMPPVLGVRQESSGQIGAPSGRRRVYFEDSGWIDNVPIFDGAQFFAGYEIPGPAIIEEATTTLVIGPLQQVEVDPFGDYMVRMNSVPEGSVQ